MTELQLHHDNDGGANRGKLSANRRRWKEALLASGDQTFEPGGRVTWHLDEPWVGVKRRLEEIWG